MEKRNLLSAALLAAAWLAGGCAMAWDEPTQVEGVYQIGTASELEWFSEYVNGAKDYPTAAAEDVAERSLRLHSHAVLTADINMTGVEHEPIARVMKDATNIHDTYKFEGTFDGRHHVISNMVINRPNDEYIALFGALRGNAIIKNIILDESCSITGKNRVASIAASFQIAPVVDGIAYTMQILNCVNYASVTATNGAAGGILGAALSSGPWIDMENCVNAGPVKAADTKAAAFCAYNSYSTNPSKIWNCLNIAVVSTPNASNQQLARQTTASLANTYDTYYTESKYQGEHRTFKTDDPLHSGELCYLLNTALNVDGEPNADAIAFTQDLSDPNSIPLPIARPGMTVYEIGTFKCDGTPKGDVVYTNTNTGSSITDAHVIKPNGFCENCSANPVTSLAKDAQGYYLISNAAELEKFSDIVEVGGQSTANKAKLTADIDMAGVTHKPIGGDINGENRFHSIFDGQGHTISNLTAFTRTDGVGLFGYVQGTNNNNTPIKNIIIDETCSFTGTEHVAAFVAMIKGGNNENVRFEKCINRANVTCSGNHAAAFVAKSFENTARVNMINCGNAGTITSEKNACALVSWFTGGTIKNCWNTGEVVKSDWDKENGADYDGSIIVSTLNLFNGTAAFPTSLVNTFDASATAERTQGTLLDASAAASGELTYKITGDWRQTIGTDMHPVFNGEKVLYLGENDYATMVADADTKLNGVQAYIVKTNGATATLTEVDDVPAGKAVVLKGTYYNKVACTATADCTGNELVAATSDVECNGTQYVLANVNDVVGFYKANSGTIKAGKGYLVSTASVKAFFFGDDATGIELTPFGDGQNGDNGQQTTEIFNLSGQRVSKMQKGVNIVNGKKVMF